MKKKLAIFFACFFSIAIIFLAGMRVSYVKVTGNHMYTEEEVERIVFPDGISRNTALCMFRILRGEKQNLPFVEDYKVSLLSPATAEIILYEKSIVGYVSYMSSNMYFDKDGVIVESSTRKLDGIPEITGLKFGQIVLYQKLPVNNENIFAMILNLTQTLATNGIPADKIRYDGDWNATLSIGDVNVLLGTAEEMNGKLSELSNIYPEIQSLSGTLDLSDYDSTNANRMYSFKKH